MTRRLMSRENSSTIRRSQYSVARPLMDAHATSTNSDARSIHKELVAAPEFLPTSMSMMRLETNNTPKGSTAVTIRSRTAPVTTPGAASHKKPNTRGKVFRPAERLFRPCDRSGVDACNFSLLAKTTAIRSPQAQICADQVVGGRAPEGQ